MKLGVIKETKPDENRVAATPDSVKALIKLGFDVTVEEGAGDAASLPDRLYESAGATFAKTRDDTVAGADVILTVRGLGPEGLAKVQSDALLLGLLDPYGDKAAIEAYAKAGIRAVALEFVPRISCAQAMDALSSQANLAGYRAVLEAAHYYRRAFPMLMTAAGTIAPARVLIMGAGVAGLQAIATARRLGAVVSATDVRLAAKEQVESLGAKFVMVEDDEVKDAETAGGYAKEMSDAYKKKQAALIAETIKKQDIVITTALIPGRPAPLLVSDEMLKSMKPGSVLVDLAVEQGGNIEGARAGEIVRRDGVTIVGHRNLPSLVATDASALYAKNLLSYLTPLVDTESGKLVLPDGDEIIEGSLITNAGRIIHPRLLSAA